jgi:DNA-binding transcriptional ArsR family regulator
MTDEMRLDLAFAALASPTRRAILARLSLGEATVNELAEPFRMSLPAVSKHIRVLEDAGFISRSKNAQFRPCRLDSAPLEAVAGWSDQYRHIWEVRFDAMEKALKNRKENGNG